MFPESCTLLSPSSARDLLRPVLSRFLAGADLEIALDSELMLADGRGGSVLLLPSDEVIIEGDLVLDHEAASFHGSPFIGVVAPGSLTITGDLLNDNWDGGPFLVALGALSMRHVIKRGAPVMATGRVTASGIIYAAYNHGCFRAWNGVTAEGVIIDDHLVELAGDVAAVRVSLREDDIGRYLMPDLLWEEDDGSVVPMDDIGDEIIARMRQGRPVFRPDSPRG